MNPESDEVVERVQDHLFAFLRALHDAGLSVPTPKQLDFLRSIEILRPGSGPQLYWAARATLTTGPQDTELFDPVFEEYFGTAPPTVIVEPEPPRIEDEEQAAPGGSRGPEPSPFEGTDAGGLEASTTDRVVGRGFGVTGEAERRLLAELARDLATALPRTRSRRRQRGSRRESVDLRTVYRRSLRTQGEIIDLRFRHRPARPRRVLVLIDVSGSMKRHSADYLRFAHTVLSTGVRAEVFTFGTRLTHVTAALRHRDVDVALAALSGIVLDADGGTRIGESLQDFLSRTRHVTMARGALVIVLSDGLERGDCTEMGLATRRLARLGHRLLWWSPLACDPDYRPLTRGLAAILGDLDELAGVGDLATAHAQVRRGLGARPLPRPLARSSVRQESHG
jgi:uncharacterized protein with von Willebrand factor type A (vWA) domain